MSYIDTLEHQLMGHFSGVPVYYLLEPSEDTYEFIAPKGAITIGGGGGEHPAIVFPNPQKCAAHYVGELLTEALEVFDKNPDALSSFGAGINFNYAEIYKDEQAGFHKIDDGLEDIMEVTNSNYYEARKKMLLWDHLYFHDKQDFFELAKSYGIPTPFHRKTHIRLEDYLINSIGEFVLFSCPELCKDVYDLLPRGRDHFPNHVKYNNIAVFNPSYPNYLDPNFNSSPYPFYFHE